jgi:hypothetical protein
VLRLRRNDAETLPCCFCRARIGKSGADLTFLKVFPGRTHAGYNQFWTHRNCLDRVMHPSFAPDLDDDEAYGSEREDRGLAVQPEPLPCCFCAAGIARDDRIGLWVNAGFRDDDVVFWTHRSCMDKALSRESRRELHASGGYGL